VVVCAEQVIQIFESWAHQLSPSQFLAFSKPYAEKVTAIIKERHPEVGGLLLRARVWVRMAPGETRGA
jgi:uroporphyrinogen-III decarboxylase